MIDIENAVYELVCSAAEEAFPGIRCVSELTISPASFPALAFAQSDNALYRRTLDGTQIERHALTSFDLNVFSNLEAGGKEECRAIFQVADRLLMGLGFTRLSYGFARNPETRISRAVARYQAVVGEDFRIYRR